MNIILQVFFFLTAKVLLDENFLKCVQQDISPKEWKQIKENIGRVWKNSLGYSTVNKVQRDL